MAKRGAGVPARYRHDGASDSDDDSEPYLPSRAGEARGEKKKRRKANEIPQFVDQKRQTFSKRKKGMVSKAAQLSHLTGAKIFIFMANDNNHSWAYATQNFEVAASEETLRLMRQLAGITSATAGTEIMEHPRTATNEQDDDQQDEEQEERQRRPAHTRVTAIKAEADQDNSSDTAAAAPGSPAPRGRSRAKHHGRQRRKRQRTPDTTEDEEEPQEESEPEPEPEQEEEEEEDDMGEALQALQHMRSGAAAGAEAGGAPPRPIMLPPPPPHMLPPAGFPFPPPHAHMAPPPHAFDGHPFPAAAAHMAAAGPYRPMGYPPFYGHPAAYGYGHPAAWPAMPPMAYPPHLRPPNMPMIKPEDS